MKSIMNKYAQLVEAQSPEPQEKVHDDELDMLVESAKVRSNDASLIVPTSSSSLPSSSSYADENKGGSSSDGTIDCSNQGLIFTGRELSQSSIASQPRQQQQPQQQLQHQTTLKSSKLDLASSSQSSSSNMTSGQCFVSLKSSNSLNDMSKSILPSDSPGIQVKQGESFRIIWKNLSFSYDELKCTTNLRSKAMKSDTSATSKSINVLNNISGSIESNKLIAIIGPSGCGKTTFLQFLAGNITNRTSNSRLKIDGLREPKVAFIGQDDGLLPGLSVKETLIYASRLQNNDKDSVDFDHHKHIETILKNLNLHKFANRCVTKLSGGQAKRITIAQELLYPTNILILDEVTSGLDASTSYSIVKLLKRSLTLDKRYPMSIIMSIHQPSAKLFSMFDQVYVMSGGHCLYDGSCEISHVNNYLKQFGLFCPTYHNIADYLIEIASDDLASNGANAADDDHKQLMIHYQQKRALTSNIEIVCDPTEKSMTVSFKNGDNNLNDEEDIDQAESRNLKDNQLKTNGNGVLLMNHLGRRSSTPTSDNDLFTSIKVARSKRSRPVYRHLWIHLERSILRIRRSYILTYLQLITYILLGLQLATFYGSDIGVLSGCPQLPSSLISYILSSNNQQQDNVNLEMRRIQENMNFLLVAVMTATFAALEITVITFPLEAKTIKREWRNGWYKVTSYFIGRTLADLPFQLVFIVIFCILIYTLTGQNNTNSSNYVENLLLSWRFHSFVLIIVMIALVAQSVGFIFGAIFMNNLPAAVFTAPLCIFPALLFSGFFARVSQIPSFYKPLTYLSHFRYAFDSLIVTLYGFNRCDCDQDVLTNYHLNLKNQTGSLREVFNSLFGTVDSNCKSALVNSDDNDIEDDVTGATLNNLLKSVATSTTIFPSNNATTPMKSLEDVLVDTVFEHMKGNSTLATIATSNHTEDPRSASDVLVDKFSTKLTTMLNSHANFGHQLPTECKNFNSYLMTEFDLNNDDLMFGLLMLFSFVIMSRLLSNAILTVTIASRN